MHRRRGNSRCRCLAQVSLRTEEAAATIAHTVGQTVLGTVRITAGQFPQHRRTRHSTLQRCYETPATRNQRQVHSTAAARHILVVQAWSGTTVCKDCCLIWRN
jgi:hypothetical protein